MFVDGDMNNFIKIYEKEGNLCEWILFISINYNLMYEL
jgi:hypothetical protein